MTLIIIAVGVLLAGALQLLAFRAIVRREIKTMNDQETALVASLQSQTDRLKALNADQTAQIATLTAKLAADDAASNAMAQQIAALQASGDTSALDAALGGIVTELEGIGVVPTAPPAAPADPTPAPAPADPAAPVDPSAAPAAPSA